MHQTKYRAFTLIELLVVIAIIGLLSSVVLASLNGARDKAKDAKIRSDMHQMQIALQLYYDKNGALPVNPDPLNVSPASLALAPLVAQGFISGIPTSPNSSYVYRYYDYGPGAVGGLIVAYFIATAPSLQYSGSCRPFAPATNWCDQASNQYYCICNPY